MNRLAASHGMPTTSIARFARRLLLVAAAATTAVMTKAVRAAAAAAESSLSMMGSRIALITTSNSLANAAAGARWVGESVRNGVTEGVTE